VPALTDALTAASMSPCDMEWISPMDVVVTRLAPRARIASKPPCTFTWVKCACTCVRIYVRRCVYEEGGMPNRFWPVSGRAPIQMSQDTTPTSIL
jgi:hypothetical protein